MKLVLSIYDYGVVMHMQFCQDILIPEEVLSFDCLNLKKINRPQP